MVTAILASQATATSAVEIKTTDEPILVGLASRISITSDISGWQILYAAILFVFLIGAFFGWFGHKLKIRFVEWYYYRALPAEGIWLTQSGSKSFTGKAHSSKMCSTLHLSSPVMIEYCKQCVKKVQ